jgi:Leucine-rich repeat (LRR) protein
LPETFGSLTSLEELNISGARLKSLPESFGNLHSLKFLNINSSELETLPESFGKLHTLETLHISSSRLALSGEVLNGFPALKEMSIQGGDPLVNTIGTLSKLEKLTLQMEGQNGPGLLVLPGSFGKLCNLHELNLACGSLEEHDTCIGKLPQLKILNISGNLSSLPESIGNLSSLKKLKIQADIEQIPAFIGKLTGLDDLMIRSKKLTSVPAFIGGMKSLIGLSFYETQIAEFPDSIGNLDKLRVLRIRGKQYHQSTVFYQPSQVSGKAGTVRYKNQGAPGISCRSSFVNGYKSVRHGN